MATRATRSSERQRSRSRCCSAQDREYSRQSASAPDQTAPRVPDRQDQARRRHLPREPLVRRGARAVVRANHRCDGYVGPVRLEGGEAVPMTKSPDIVTPDPTRTPSRRRTPRSTAARWTVGASSATGAPHRAPTTASPTTTPRRSRAWQLASKYVVSDRTFSLQDSPSWGGHMAVARRPKTASPETSPGRHHEQGMGMRRRRSRRLDLTDWDQVVSTVVHPRAGRHAQPHEVPVRRRVQADAVPSVPTIFDRLDATHRPWKLYSSVPTGRSARASPSACTHRNTRTWCRRAVLADAKHGPLPAYSVLLPSGPGGTGQHTGLDAHRRQLDRQGRQRNSSRSQLVVDRDLHHV